MLKGGEPQGSAGTVGGIQAAPGQPAPVGGGHEGSALPAVRLDWMFEVCL